MTTTHMWDSGETPPPRRCIPDQRLVVVKGPGPHAPSHPQLMGTLTDQCLVVVDAENHQLGVAYFVAALQSFLATLRGCLRSCLCHVLDLHSDLK